MLLHLSLRDSPRAWAGFPIGGSQRFLILEGIGQPGFGLVLVAGNGLGQSLVVLLLLGLPGGGNGLPEVLFIGLLNFVGGLLQAGLILLAEAGLILAHGGRTPGFGGGTGVVGIKAGLGRAAGNEVLASVVLSLKLLELGLILALVPFDFVRQLGFIVLLELGRGRP